MQNMILGANSQKILTRVGTGEVVKQGKIPLGLTVLGPVSRIHMREEENDFYKLSSDTHEAAVAHACSHT